MIPNHQFSTRALAFTPSRRAKASRSSSTPIFSGSTTGGRSLSTFTASGCHLRRPRHRLLPGAVIPDVDAGPGGHRRGHPGSAGPGFRPRVGVSFGRAVARQMAMSHPQRESGCLWRPPRSAGPPCPAVPLRCCACCIRAATSDRLARNAGAMFGGRMPTGPELAADLKMSKSGSLRAAAFRLSALAGCTSLATCRRSGTRRWFCAGTMTR